MFGVLSRHLRFGGEVADIGGNMLGVWGLCPQRGLGAEPLAGGLGGRSPPEAENVLLHK